MNISDAIPHEGLPPPPLAERALSGRRRTESIAISLLLLATLLAALPALGVVGLLLVKGAPVLSFEFLFTMPIRGMTAGGIWPAIVGTIWFVGVSLAFSVPIGVLAGIYLSEYAGDSFFARMIDLA